MTKIGKKEYLCIGCGACKTVCKHNSISIVEDCLGRYRASVDENSCINCNICESVCPIYQKLDVKVGEQYNSIVGTYQSCYKGYDDRFRKTSASGGLLTSLLYMLLVNRTVDTVVCLQNKKRASSFYQYAFITSPDELMGNGRSAYYPMEMSEMLEYIKRHEGRYALVVLPCQAKAIRLLQKKDKKLRERIRFLLGLVCGGLPGKALVEYVSQSLKHSVDDINSIIFREKESGVRNNNYSIALRLNHGGVVRSYFQHEKFGFAYLNKLFHYKACNICNDIFAEYADAVFMDAWLEEHRMDDFGTSICITRNKDLTSITEKFFLINPNIYKVNVEVAIRAQNNVGLVVRKKKQAVFKYWLYRKFGFLTLPDTIKLSFIERLKFLLRGMQEFIIQYKVEIYWKRYKMNTLSFDDFNNKVAWLVKIVKCI